MANFDRVNPTGWGFKADLTSAELNQLDIDHAKAINGDDGSSHTPASKIIIGGAGLELSAPLTVQLGSRSVTRAQSMSGAAPIAGTWTIGNGGVWTNIATAGAVLVVPLDRLPNGAVLQEVHVQFQGVAGHTNDPVNSGGALIMPTVELHETSLTDGSTTLVATVNDTVVAKAQYEANHVISLTGLAKTIAHDGHHYAVSIIAESGADYIAGAIAWGLKTVADVTAMDEG